MDAQSYIETLMTKPIKPRVYRVVKESFLGDYRFAAFQYWLKTLAVYNLVSRQIVDSFLYQVKQNDEFRMFDTAAHLSITLQDRDRLFNLLPDSVLYLSPESVDELKRCIKYIGPGWNYDCGQIVYGVQKYPGRSRECSAIRACDQTVGAKLFSDDIPEHYCRSTVFLFEVSKVIDEQ